MKVRPAGSFQTLDEALARAVEVRSREELVTYMQREYSYWSPTDESVSIEPYGYDARCGWDTYIVCVDGKAALFADGGSFGEPQTQMTDPVQKAVDDYIEMQRKAAAWDMLYFFVKTEVSQGGTSPGLPPAELLVQLDKLLAQVKV